MRSRVPVRAVALALGAALVVAAGPSEAGGGGRADVRRFDRMGKAAYQQGRFDDAIAAFEAAYELGGEPKYLFNLGKCHQKSGDLHLAIRHLRRYVRDAPDAPDAATVQALAELLERRLRKTRGRVAITSAPDGALVELEGEGDTVEAVTPYSGWLPFGSHELRVSLQGYLPEVRGLVVRPGEPLEIRVELVAEQDPAPGAPDQAGTPDQGRRKQPQSRPQTSASPPRTSWVAWTALGVGAALLAAGSVVGLAAANAEEERDQLVASSRTEDVRMSRYEEADATARSRALTANVLYGAGALAAVAGGVVIVVTDTGAAAQWALTW